MFKSQKSEKGVRNFLEKSRAKGFKKGPFRFLEPPPACHDRQCADRLGRQGKRSPHHVELRSINMKLRGGLLQAVKQSFEQLSHRLESITEKQRAHALPQQPFAANFLLHRAKQGTTQLL